MRCWGGVLSTPLTVEQGKDMQLYFDHMRKGMVELRRDFMKLSAKVIECGKLDAVPNEAKPSEKREVRMGDIREREAMVVAPPFYVTSNLVGKLIN